MIALLAAMDTEIVRLRDELRETRRETWGPTEFYFGMLCEREVVLTKSGVGKVLASAVTQRVLDRYKPDAVVLTGLAGALNMDFEIGDVIVARDLIQHDMDASPLGFPRGAIPYTDIRFLSADQDLQKLALGAACEQRILSGRIATGDQFFTHAETISHRYLIDELQADAVEMEAAAVGIVCELNRTPLLVAKTISDRADEDAHLDYSAFLPKASENSWKIIQHVLTEI